MHVLAINCGSSSIKGKLYSIESKSAELETVAELSINNISSSGEKIKIQIEWTDSTHGENIDEEGEDGAEAECKFHKASLEL